MPNLTCFPFSSVMPDFALPPSSDLKLIEFRIGSPQFRIGVVLVDSVSFSSCRPELSQNRVSLKECNSFEDRRVG